MKFDPQLQKPSAPDISFGHSLPDRRWLTVVIALCLLPTLLPGDVPWINDEPNLILNALRSNQAHRFVQLGIMGSNGVRYGPLPTWLYQAFLVFSHDLRILVILRAALTMVSCAIGLSWLARGLRVSHWLVPISLASPYLWLYSRPIWDNTFLIPLAALSLGAYIAFLEERRVGLLLIAVGCALIAPLIHLMALALVGPMMFHALMFARRDMWRARYGILAIIIAWLMIGYGYLTWLLANHSSMTASGSVIAAGFPFIGGRWLSGVGLDEFFQDSWQQIVSGPAWLDLMRLMTGFLLPAVWAGMVIASAELRSGGGRRPALSMLVMVVAAQMLLNGTSGAAGPSHYFNATWPAYAAFSWLTFDRLVAFKPTRWIPGIIGASLVVVIVTVMVRVHRLGGTRGASYGPVLSNQIAIARGLNEFRSDSPVQTDVTNFVLYPQGIRVLRLLDDRRPNSSTRANILLIRYDGPPASGRVALVHP